MNRSSVTCSLLGHERIGLINWHPGILVGDVREAGYRSAMQRAGDSRRAGLAGLYPEHLALGVGGDGAVDGRQTILRPPSCAPTTSWPSGQKPIWTNSGYRDVALTGYDDDPAAEFWGITSVRQPINEVAEILFDILLGEINA